MTQSCYPVPAQSGQVELTIKRSKFVSIGAPAADRQQAEQFIQQIRTRHPQANHVCWAYIAGPPDTTVRSMSDDGEPSGTAGMPMLNVLQHSGLGDIVVTVVRYFGGIKLGTGGLQRAYSDAVSQLLAELPRQNKVSRTQLTLQYDYPHDGVITRLLSRYEVVDIQRDFGTQIKVQVAVADTQLTELRAQLTNATSGDIVIAAS